MYHQIQKAHTTKYRTTEVDFEEKLFVEDNNAKKTIKISYYFGDMGLDILLKISY